MKHITTFLFFLFSLSISSAQTNGFKTINYYYQQLVNEKSIAAINKSDSTYMTTFLLAKSERMWNSTHRKPTLRTNTLNKQTFIKNLIITQSVNNWYFVQFKDSNNKDIVIPIHVNKENKIDYVTPEYLGYDNCDCLFTNNSVRYHEVNDTEQGTEFLKSFYYLYGQAYCKPQEKCEWQKDTKFLRELHLTPQANYAFYEIQKSACAKGWNGYDALIDEYDFDRPSLDFIDVTVINKMENKFQVSFPFGAKLEVLIVTLFNDDGVWKIDKVRGSQKDIY